MTSEAQLIHCNHQPGCEELGWMENGFIQCFTRKDGRSARVADYAPGQRLQPHFHDIDGTRRCPLEFYLRAAASPSR